LKRKLAALPGAVFVLTTVLNASPLYNFETFNGPGDHEGGTTVNGISNAGAIVGFSSNADRTQQSRSSTIPTQVRTRESRSRRSLGLLGTVLLRKRPP